MMTYSKPGLVRIRLMQVLRLMQINLKIQIISNVFIRKGPDNLVLGLFQIKIALFIFTIKFFLLHNCNRLHFINLINFIFNTIVHCYELVVYDLAWKTGTFIWSKGGELDCTRGRIPKLKNLVRTAINFF